MTNNYCLNSWAAYQQGLHNGEAIRKTANDRTCANGTLRPGISAYDKKDIHFVAKYKRKVHKIVNNYSIMKF